MADTEYFDSIMRGLEEMRAHVNGKIKLRSRRVEVTPPKDYSAEDIKLIRVSLEMPQRLFAGVIGVSPKTVEAWESGINKPSGAATRMLMVMEKDPEAVRRYGFAQW
jgi:putative transcriptional regulator